jgi:type II secretion system protein N
MATDITAHSDETTQTIEARRLTKGQRAMRNAGWSALAIFSLLVFTIVKLPEARIKAYVQGTISSVLAPRGITFTAQKGHLSIGWGFSYVMEDVTLSFPPPDAPVHIDEISFKPSLFNLIFRKLGGDAAIYNGDGKLTLSFSTKDSWSAFSFKAKDLDVGKLGILPALAGVAGSGIVAGSGWFDGDLNNLSAAKGELDVTLKKIVVDQQPIMGFSLPRLSVSEGRIDADIESGKVKIQTLTLGRAGNSADDIVASVTGDLTLGKTIYASPMNLKAKFSLSQNILKSFAILDAFLISAKTADGGYAYNLSGTLGSPLPVPAGSPGAAAAPAAPSVPPTQRAAPAAPAPGGATREE